MTAIQMVRLVGTLVLGGTLLVCLVGAFAIADLSPRGLYRRLGGITIQTPTEHVRITRRHLDCSDAAPDGTRETCRLTIDGDAVTVAVTHDPNNHWSFSECSVSFRGVTTACRAGTYTVTGPPHAFVGRLGLPDEVIRSLRWQHFLTSRWEAGWLELASGMAAMLAVGVVLVVGGWATGPLVRRLVLVTASGAGTFAIAYGAVLVLLLVTDAVD